MIGQKLILTLNFRLVSIISKLAQIQHIWTKIEETLACTITFRPQMICFLNSKDRTASKLGQFEPFLVQRELAQWRVVHRTAPNATFTGRTQRPPRNSFKRNTSHSAQNSWKGIYGFGWTCWTVYTLIKYVYLNHRIMGQNKTRTSRDVDFLRHSTRGKIVNLVKLLWTLGWVELWVLDQQSAS